MPVTINGNTGINTPLGSTTTSSHGNTTAANSGLYFPTSTTVGLAVNGANALTADTTGVSDAIGNVRTIVQNSQTTGYTLVATDNGKIINITTGGVTIPASIFSAGQNIVIYNNSTSAQTITQGSSTTVTLAGTTTTGNRTLSANGIATIICTGSNAFLITGTGVS
jgi:hypothetical protein